MVRLLMILVSMVMSLIFLVCLFSRESELGSHGEVADDFAVIVKGLWCGQYKCMTPRDFKVSQTSFYNISKQFDLFFSGSYFPWGHYCHDCLIV